MVRTELELREPRFHPCTEIVQRWYWCTTEGHQGDVEGNHRIPGAAGLPEDLLLPLEIDTISVRIYHPRRINAFTLLAGARRLSFLLTLGPEFPSLLLPEHGVRVRASFERLRHHVVCSLG